MRSGNRTLIPSDGAGELAILDRIRRRATPYCSGEIRLGIGDDCAILRLKPGEETLVTTDLSIENRHFRLETHPPEAVGHRTLARGLSDIAAMGARPVAAFLSLGLPQKLTRTGKPRAAGPRAASPETARHGAVWIDRFLDGFLALAAKHRTPLAGGDLAECPVAMADIILVGAVPKGKALLRSGARPGDLIYVTGALGGSAAGLRSLGGRPSQKGLSQPDLAPHLWPEPRIAQGRWLREHRAASAAIDISDGLSTDLGHLCLESGVSAEIDAHRLPIFPGATLSDALHGGEDYELLFTARPNARLPRRIAGVSITRIGRVVRSGKGSPRVCLVDAEGRHPLERRGWEHFRRAGERS